MHNICWDGEGRQMIQRNISGTSGSGREIVLGIGLYGIMVQRSITGTLGNRMPGYLGLHS